MRASAACRSPSACGPRSASPATASRSPSRLRATRRSHRDLLAATPPRPPRTWAATARRPAAATSSACRASRTPSRRSRGRAAPRSTRARSRPRSARISRAHGGVLTADDLAAHRSDWVEPARVALPRPHRRRAAAELPGLRRPADPRDARARGRGGARRRPGGLRRRRGPRDGARVRGPRPPPVRPGLRRHPARPPARPGVPRRARRAARRRRRARGRARRAARRGRHDLQLRGRRRRQRRRGHPEHLPGVGLGGRRPATPACCCRTAAASSRSTPRTPTASRPASAPRTR